MARKYRDHSNQKYNNTSGVRSIGILLGNIMK